MTHDTSNGTLQASASQAGLFLVPTTIAMLIFSPLGGRLSNVVGSKVPLVLGSAMTTVSFVVLAAASAKWEMYVASALLGVGVGVGVGFAFASLANLIVEAPPRPDRSRIRHEHDRADDRRRDRG
jgi:MFS family permease